MITSANHTFDSSLWSTIAVCVITFSSPCFIKTSYRNKFSCTSILSFAGKNVAFRGTLYRLYILPSEPMSDQKSTTQFQTVSCATRWAPEIDGAWKVVDADKFHYLAGRTKWRFEVSCGSTNWSSWSLSQYFLNKHIRSCRLEWIPFFFHPFHGFMILEVVEYLVEMIRLVRAHR